MFKKTIYTLGITCLAVCSFAQNAFANEVNVIKGIDIGEQVKYEGYQAPLLYSNGNSNKNLFLEMVNESELKKDNVNVCIYDDYKKEHKYEDSSEIFYHGSIVEDFLNKYIYKDNSIKLHRYESYSNDLFYKGYDETIKNCDIMNISMSFFIDDNTIPETTRKEYEKMLAGYLDEFLAESNAFVVASAGNAYKDANQQTLFAIMRETIKDSKNKYNYLVTGQIEKKSSYNNSFAYGESVDIMVANKWEVIGDYQYTGTSYASPVISAIAANLFLAGFNYEEIHNLLTSSSIIYQDNYSTYPVLNEDEIYKKAIEEFKIKEDLFNKQLEIKKRNESLEFKLFKAFNKIHKTSFNLNSQ